MLPFIGYNKTITQIHKKIAGHAGLLLEEIAQSRSKSGKLGRGKGGVCAAVGQHELIIIIT